MSRNRIVLLLVAVAVVAFVAARLGAASNQSAVDVDQSQPGYIQPAPVSNPPALATRHAVPVVDYWQRQLATQEADRRQQAVDQELEKACKARGGRWYSWSGSCSK